MAMLNIFIDTNILIDHTHGKNKILYTLLLDQKQKTIELFINPVVIAEFLTDKRLLDKNKLEKALDFLKLFQSVEITTSIGFISGQLLREGRIIVLNDALIAATCLAHDFKLVTRNKKHFHKIPGLQLYSPGV